MKSGTTISHPPALILNQNGPPGAEEVRWPDFGGEIPSIAMFLRVPSSGEPCKTERSTVPLQPSDFRKPTGSTGGVQGRFPSGILSFQKDPNTSSTCKLFRAVK